MHNTALVFVYNGVFQFVRGSIWYTKLERSCDKTFCVRLTSRYRTIMRRANVYTLSNCSTKMGSSARDRGPMMNVSRDLRVQNRQRKEHTDQGAYVAQLAARKDRDFERMTLVFSRFTQRLGKPTNRSPLLRRAAIEDKPGGTEKARILCRNVLEKLVLFTTCLIIALVFKNLLKGFKLGVEHTRNPQKTVLGVSITSLPAYHLVIK